MTTSIAATPWKGYFLDNLAVHLLLNRDQDSHTGVVLFAWSIHDESNVRRLPDRHFHLFPSNVVAKKPARVVVRKLMILQVLL